MVECEYSVLLQIYDNIEKIMQCLEMGREQNSVTFKEDEITSIIINNLYQTLNFLKNEDRAESKEGTHDSDEMYDNIEKQLQKQENLNRILIKKELEFKQYQKCLLDELSDERKKVKQLQNQLNRINDRVLSKDLEIMHLNNEKKMISKDKKTKEMLMIETIANEKKMGDPFKYIKESANLHQRRKSDELTRRASTANPKKKSSVSKK